jgi:hypothetical protein
MHIGKQAKLGTALVAGGMALAAAQTGTISVHDDIAKNPAYVLKEAHPAAFMPQVGDMAWLDANRVVVLEFQFAVGDRENTTGVPKKNGTLYVVSNLDAADPEQIKFDLVAKDLGEPTGVCVVNGKIYVAEKLQLTEFTLGAPGAMATPRKVADITVDPAGLVNFQEYNFGLVYKDGYFYTATGGGVRLGGVSWSDDMGKLSDTTRSTLLKIKADGSSKEIVVGGLRAPNGLTIGPDGDFWATDNQGSYLPACKLIHLVPGRNYGYTNGPNRFRGMAETPPTVWFPYAEIGKSITHPTLMKKGTFAGQFLVGDLSQGGMMRAAVEKVNGEWQGSVHSFGGGFSAGIEASLEMPDGSYLLGGLGRGDAGNWGWRAKVRGFQRLTPVAGTVNFEMYAVRAKANGLEVEFTKPVGAGADAAANYTVFSGEMTPGPKYGEGNMLNKTVINVAAVKLSDDKKRVFLQLDGLANHVKKVIAVKVGAAVKSAAGEDVYRPAAWYTLNSMSTVEFSTASSIRGRARVQGLTADDIAVRRTGAGLAVSVPFAGDHVLTLRDMRGRTVESRRGAGQAEYRLGANGLRAGVYLLDLEVGGQALRKSVVF